MVLRNALMMITNRSFKWIMSDVGVINYGMGNIDSVCRAIEKIGYEVSVINKPSQLHDVARIILPGVGAYPAAMPDSYTHVTPQTFYA